MSQGTWLLVTVDGPFTATEFADVYTLADLCCIRFFAIGKRIRRTRGMVKSAGAKHGLFEWASYEHAGYEELLVVSLDITQGILKAVPCLASKQKEETP